LVIDFRVEDATPSVRGRLHGIILNFDLSSFNFLTRKEAFLFGLIVGIVIDCLEVSKGFILPVHKEGKDYKQGPDDTKH